jgi:hypothetical protein
LVLHVRELPPSWLGKNHACCLGAEAATGAFLLFTDADVHYGPGALRRAVSYALTHRLGHLAVVPSFVASGFLERGLLGAFLVVGSAKLRLWELSRAGTSAFVGVGAFNLVRREAYLGVGGHSRLAMEVVDDVKLGLLLRRSGVAQGALDGGGLVSIRWNPGFSRVLQGLVKNAFAAAEWSWTTVLLGAVAACASTLLPLLLLFWPSRASVLLAIPVGLAVAVHAAAVRSIEGGTGLEGLFYAVCDASLIGVGLWSALLASLRGGIVWRDTFYPLPLLKEGSIRERDWPPSGAVGWD